MAVLWQNSAHADGADEEVEVHGGADRLCLLALPAAACGLEHNYFGQIIL